MKKLILAALIAAGLTGCQSQPRAEKTDTENIQQNIYNLNEVDQRPATPGILTPPQYPLEMKKRGMTGQVVLQFIVNPSGDVQDVEVVSSTNKEFEQPAIQAVQQWKFIPGRKNGRTVYTRMQVPIAFNLSKIN